jgi:integrase
MAEKKILTDRGLKALKPALKVFEVRDAIVPGLRVRVMPSGQRTFVLLGRYPGSHNPTRRALGTYGAISVEQARTRARQWLELLLRGVDPQVQAERERQAERRRQGTTFASVAEDFIKEKLPQERRGRDVECEIRREFIPTWGKRPIAEITALDVRDLIKAKARTAPYSAHGLFAIARRLFVWAIDQQVYGLESSPCDRLRPKSIIGKKLSRNRVLDDDELCAFWRAAGRLGYPWGPLFQMLALTGQRRGEVAGARWREFDLGRKLWTIPAERMKADAAHVVPLTDDVVAVLKALPRFSGGDHLFSTTFGVKQVGGFSRAKLHLDREMLKSWRALARVRSEDRRAALIDPFVVHDVRRTMRTRLSALPVPDLIRELVIAHTKPGLHRVYDLHAYVDEKRRALDLWAAELRDIVEPPPQNTVKMRATV